MEAILKFNLPEERVEHEWAVHGHVWAAIVSEVDRYLRDKLKYGHEFKSADEALEATRNFLRDEMNDSNLTLE